MRKIIVTGGRNYENREVLYRILYGIAPHEIVHGGAPGADSLAEEWAEELSTTTTIYVAEWDRLGKAAGPVRNRKMVKDNPDAALVVAFKGGKGTKHAVETARKAGIPVLMVVDPYDEDQEG